MNFVPGARGQGARVVLGDIGVRELGFLDEDAFLEPLEPGDRVADPRGNTGVRVAGKRLVLEVLVPLGQEVREDSEGIGVQIGQGDDGVSWGHGGWNIHSPCAGSGGHQPCNRPRFSLRYGYGSIPTQRPQQLQPDLPESRGSPPP